MNTQSLDANHWPLRPQVRPRQLLIALIVCVLLAFSAQRTQMDRLLALSGEAVAVGLGAPGESQVLDGLRRIGSGLWPIQLSQTRSVARLENFDRSHLPLGAHLEVREIREQTLDPQTLVLGTTVRSEEVLVEPYGYLWQVLRLMGQTLEIALWGSLLAIVFALPLALLGARNLMPRRSLRAAARAVSSLLRAVPELISALFLVLAFGFGPIAGVLALGLHAAGFLGKFFADDLENAPRGPQDALRATGAGTLVVLRHALLPQVLPAYLAYLQYIFERNVRSATVIGIVGAGGIGQELKGRFEMFDFAHVGTLLLVIFLCVVTLEAIAGRLRRRWL